MAAWEKHNAVLRERTDWLKAAFSRAGFRTGPTYDDRACGIYRSE